jgi:hypothetical protein
MQRQFVNVNWSDQSASGSPGPEKQKKAKFGHDQFQKGQIFKMEKGQIFEENLQKNIKLFLNF